ncbi:MAG TPA: glycosyltransferase family 2 protein [Thermoleophilaceae bacterium]
MTPAFLPGLTIVLPCFNEEDNVREAVAAALRAGRRFAEHCEVLVVDDGSTDATGEIGVELVELHPEVRLLLHPVNLGYGAALRTGIRAATEPFVLLTDADLQFDLGELADFVPLTEDAEVIAGYRIDRQDSFSRRLAAAGWNALVRSLYGLRVRDVDCAFKLIRRDLIQSFTLRSTGAMISTELLVKCIDAGGRVAEVGVHHYPRPAGRASGGDPRVVAHAFRELAQLHSALTPVAKHGA